MGEWLCVTIHAGGVNFPENQGVRHYFRRHRFLARATYVDREMSQVPFRERLRLVVDTTPQFSANEGKFFEIENDVTEIAPGLAFGFGI